MHAHRKREDEDVVNEISNRLFGTSWGIVVLSV